MRYVVVRIIHGSVRRRHYRREAKELGGKMGGHVGIQIDDLIYDFKYRDISRIHIFSNPESKNCIFQKHTPDEWTACYKDNQETLVTIPVDETEIEFLLDFYRKNILEPSYDYSFFGQRCASSCYDLLKKINKIQGGHYFFNAFYPGMLRKKLLAKARQAGYGVVVIPGSPTRIWEGGRVDI
ncbi:MAG: hypothetical protein R2791_17560 [Saprospiraceae bacterium]|nr:hypothetical protein [Saprospiraceae bacterium]MCB9353242.1 hypothetical protein [Lewinellaceae bacterium]